MDAPSPTQAALYAALARAIAKSAAVGKDAQNTFHKYKYASAEAVIEEARGALAGEGLAAIPVCWRLLPRENADGGYFADVEVTYLITHADGGSLPCTAVTPTIREKGRPEDKAVATALTYNLGYFLRNLLMLPRVDEEHDVDRRDDRGYEPRGGRPNGSATTSSKTAPPPGQQTPDKHAAPTAEVDVDGALVAIREAETIDDLRRLGAGFAAVPEGPAKRRIRSAYSDRMSFLQATPPPPAAAPAKEVA